jgi:tetratricopeptide (TPR) repeat protein
VVSAVPHFHSVSLGELPPPPPRDCFGRDELIEEVVRLAQKLEPIALIGAGGIGKTSIALAVIHHNRIKKRFGENRRFIRCDQFPPSRAHFLARLSKVIGAGVENPKELSLLQPSLSSKETLIILDNAESVLDPRGASAQKIYSLVDELCRFKNICLLITSRITTVPPHCKRPEIPTLSMKAACDIFYGIYGNRRKSHIINDLLYRLGFHALSIKLLATTASHNTWDYERLAKEWDARRARVLRTNYNESLAATIELSLNSPTFRSLDPKARDLLGVVAFFPQGIDERNLNWLFPTLPNRKNLFDIFCLLSLAYRSNGFVTMLAPIREYLSHQDPRSSPLLCIARDHYFARLSVDADPDNPGRGEGRWVVSEGVNIEHLLDVYTSINSNSKDIWDACYHFLIHLYWHKPRKTILRPKIEALTDDHPSKPKCLCQLAQLFGQAGNHAEQKRLMNHVLELERRRRDDAQVAATLRRLSDVNRLLNLHEEGIRQVQEALEILNRISDRVEQSRCLNHLAYLLLGDKQPDAAQNAASRAIDLVPKKGQEFLVCDILLVLGEIHRTKGEKKEAINHLEAALGIASPFDWHTMQYWIHSSLARLFEGGGELDDANAHIEQCKFHSVDNPHRLGRATLKQAKVWHRQLKLEDAKSEALRALEIFEKLGNAEWARDCRSLLHRVEGAMKKRSTRLPGELLENNTTSYVCLFLLPSLKYTIRRLGKYSSKRRPRIRGIPYSWVRYLSPFFQGIGPGMNTRVKCIIGP